MPRNALLLAALLAGTVLYAQPWSLSLPNAHGAGPAALPLANGDVLLYSALEQHLLRVDNTGNTVWGVDLPDLGTFAAVTEQPNGDLVAVTYLDDPNGSIAASPGIVRLSGTGQLLGGVRYAQDSTWAVRRGQVVNADNGHYFVLYNGDNAHRIAYFNATDAEQWTLEFTGPGFALHAAWVSGDGLHAFNGPLHFVLTTGGQVAWQTYMQPVVGALDVGSAFWDGTKLVAGIRYQPAQGMWLPGVAHLDLLGNVLAAVTFGGQDSSAQETMAIAATTTGSMLVNGDQQGALRLYTCDAQLANATAFEAPQVPLWLGMANGSAANGLAWMATEGNFFSGDRVAIHIGADGDPGGCMMPLNVVLGTLPAFVSIPNPWPVTTTTPTLLPTPVSAAAAPYALLATPTCTSVDVHAQATPDLRFWPNPTQYRVVIEAEGTALRHARINALDGRSLLNADLSSSRVELDVTTLPSGCHLLTLITADGTQHLHRLIIR